MRLKLSLYHKWKGIPKYMMEQPKLSLYHKWKAIWLATFGEKQKRTGLWVPKGITVGIEVSEEAIAISSTMILMSVLLSGQS